MTIAQPRKHPNVRQSTDSDMAAIRAWLERQDRDQVHGTFLCNWSLTEQAHQDGTLLVYVDPSTHEPVAYQWGRLIRPGILEVRDEYRGRGIGKALVEHCLALAVETGNDILQIECKPSSSIPFWKEMGFTLLERRPHQQNSEAYRVLPRRLEQPQGDGDRLSTVTVSWYQEERKWKDDAEPVETQTVKGVWFGDELELTERISFFSGLVERDTVVRVVVDGQEWYCDKAKYDEAANIGIEDCTNGVRVDTLCPPAALLSSGAR